MLEAAQATPIVPWIGGKRRLAKHILPLFPEHTCYVEPFCGAAALYFLKAPAKVEVINDVNGELVNLYRVVRHHLEEFVSSVCLDTHCQHIGPLCSICVEQHHQ